MLRPIPAKTRSVVLVCSKCSKKLGGGFGRKGSKPLAKELRKLAGAGKGRKSDLLVLETACLKLCPKGAVVVMDAAKPESWLIVPAQTDVQAVAEKIGLSNASRE
jgi:predicted metal-binding protein